ncbi:BQ5605_C006g04054 [Microbotryum silenes-dioicae]|uniref:BQ5605_C006g04054 protein n=1 Tax=Microbotryum silenes-dioicae TaxID=796604 RepID=A0A2X0MA06_9BASI|nr:BQ5605_C006g04054 [Microbotryum silenes-dioicae]
MRLHTLPVSLIALLHLCIGASCSLSTDTSNATHPPLFVAPNPRLKTYHTALSTLLPILPILAPPPTHTLLVTLATSAFKPLLYNYLCFLRYRAKWGTTSPTHEQSSGNETEPNDRWSFIRRKHFYEDTQKILIVTSDQALAEELSEFGVVVWYLDAIDWDSTEAQEYIDETLEDEKLRKEFERIIRDDLFATVRMMDLLLPPTRSESNSRSAIRQIRPSVKGFGAKMLEWGSLHYQSLMLERTLVMSTLVGALVEAQQVDTRWRVQQERGWKDKWEYHDWDNEPPLIEEPFVGVKGVLLADNDAVWLSNPASFFAHHYRPQGSHPSFVVASDTDPYSPHLSQYGLSYTPCACFIYSRTSDAEAPSASPNPLPEAKEYYSPSTGAATGWRFTAICHIAMILRSIEDGLAQLIGADNAELDVEGKARLSTLRRAIAPSFQGTSLGPAMFLAEDEDPVLPVLTHEEWMETLGSFDESKIIGLLKEAGLGGALRDLINDPEAYANNARDRRKMCEDLAISKSKRTTCPNPIPEMDRTSLTIPAQNGRAFHRGIKTEVLPYDIFPPGMRYFDGGLASGERPCVVHANYATGKTKTELLKREKLWALVQDERGQYRCDAEVMDRAK